MGIMFSPDMLELVLSGKKTQTRRRVDDADTGVDVWDDRVVYRYDRTPVQYTTVYQKKQRDLGWCVQDYLRQKWRVGNAYAIQPGRGKKGIGHIRLCMIRLERFCDISQADAEAEGFTNPDGFFAKIRELYGADFDLTAPCWVLSFQLVKEAS